MLGELKDLEVKAELEKTQAAFDKLSALYKAQDGKDHFVRYLIQEDEQGQFFVTTEDDEEGAKFIDMPRSKRAVLIMLRLVRISTANTCNL